MKFRARLALGFGAAALVPLALFGLGVRQEMTRRLGEQADRRVSALAGMIRDGLDTQAADLRARAGALARAVAGENAFRLAATGDAAARRRMIDWALEAMVASGLAMLQVQDSAGRILSSGHFRNAFDRLEPDLPSALAAAGPTGAFVLVQEPESSRLVFAVVDSVRIADHRLTVAAGVAFDGARFGGGSAGGLDVATVAGDTACTGPPPAPPSARLPFITCRPAGAAARVGRPLVGAAAPADTLALVVLRDPAEIAAITAGVDRWLGVAALVALGLVIALSAWLSARLARPLADLAAKTARVDLDRLDQDFALDRTDEIGALAGLLGAMTTRLRASAAGLREAERRAATGDLARQINHDVKNGLIPIRNILRHLTQVAASEPARLPAIFEERRGTLESSVAYLEGLARNYARLAPALDHISTSPNELLRDLARGLPPGVQVETRLASDAAAVRADPVALRRILENLLNNAVDALPEGRGTIRLATELRSDGEGRRVRLTVADTGRGMRREELERAFDDFFSTREGGTGLGLSVVRRLVIDLGGSLRVDTEPDRGTTFTIDVPAA